MPNAISLFSGMGGEPDYTKKTREELIVVCKQKSIKGYSGKKKHEIITLLTTDTTTVPEKMHRLNYIGSKFQLLDWITSNMKEKTGWDSFAGKIIGDVFLLYKNESHLYIL